MKLVYPEWEKQLRWEGGRFPLVVLEEPTYHFEIVQELYDGAHGGESRFVLSEGETILDLSRKLAVVPSPWSMDRGSRPLMTALYGRLKKDLAGPELFRTAQEAAAAVARYAGQAGESFAFPLTCDDSPDLLAFLKAVHLRPEEAEGPLAERMLAYMELCTDLLGTACFVFCGFRGYLPESDLRGLYQTAFLKKFHFLLIESHADRIVEEEDRFIVDSDLCQIF